MGNYLLELFLDERGPPHTQVFSVSLADYISARVQMNEAKVHWELHDGTKLHVLNTAERII